MERTADRCCTDVCTLSSSSATQDGRARASTVIYNSTTNNPKTYKRYECGNTNRHTRTRLLHIDGCDIHNGNELFGRYLVISFPDFVFQIPLLALTHIHAVIILLYYSLEHRYRKRKDKLLTCVVDVGVCVCAVTVSTYIISVGIN